MIETPKLGPRVKAFKEENDSNNLTLGSSLGVSITKVWPNIERLTDIFAVTPFDKYSRPRVDPEAGDFFISFECLQMESYGKHSTCKRIKTNSAAK